VGVCAASLVPAVGGPLTDDLSAARSGNVRNPPGILHAHA
jgi:hypothetical protein